MCDWLIHNKLAQNTRFDVFVAMKIQIVHMKAATSSETAPQPRISRHTFLILVIAETYLHYGFLARSR